jgi:cell division GTPase FtsZ
MATTSNAEDLAASFQKDADDAMEEYKEVKSLTKISKSQETDNTEKEPNEPNKTEETPAEQTNKEAKSKRINDYIEKAKNVLDNITSNPSIPANRLEAVKAAIEDKIQKKKDELAALPENVLNYDIKLSVIKRDLDKIMEEINQLSKPWINNKNLISESISQKFERIIKG